MKQNCVDYELTCISIYITWQLPVGIRFSQEKLTNWPTTKLIYSCFCKDKIIPCTSYSRDLSCLSTMWVIWSEKPDKLLKVLGFHGYQLVLLIFLLMETFLISNYWESPHSDFYEPSSAQVNFRGHLIQGHLIYFLH